MPKRRATRPDWTDTHESFAIAANLALKTAANQQDPRAAARSIRRLLEPIERGEPAYPVGRYFERIQQQLEELSDET